MSLDAEQLFALLPAVYRTRDAEAGGPLQQLFAVMGAQLDVVEDNILQLYDDQFIETCAPWAVPYIGDLLGYNAVYELATASGERRAEVANTIGYRRRKGTLVALEQMAADVSGRAAVAVEEFERLITTESMRLVRPRHRATVDLRAERALERLGGAFETDNHTIDVRRIAPRTREIPTPDTAPLDVLLHGGGRFNLPDVAIHLWRWQSWPVVGAPAFELGGGRYMFSPLGADMPLFSRRTQPPPFSALITRADIPAPIACHELAEFYGPGASVQLVAEGVPVDAGRIFPANLADRPGGSWCVVPPGKIAIDPELGRIQYATNVRPPRSLRLDYYYGFPAPIGGGSYDRSAALAGLDPARADLFAVVGTTAYPEVVSAVTAWNGLGPGATGIIVVPGFESLGVELTGPATIRLPAGSSLAILAGAPDPAGGPRDVIWNGSWPTLTGDVEVEGVASAGAGSFAAGQLLISGLRLAGQLLVTGLPTSVTIADCTLVPGLGLHTDGAPLLPGEPSLVVTSAGAQVVVNRVISGPIAADPSAAARICASIIDATSDSGVAYAASDLASAGADLHLEDSTVIGKVRTRTLTLASNTIFASRLSPGDAWPAAVWASRRQTGCVRFCSLPFDSITPRRYRCLPPEAELEPALEPSFVDLSYGRPAYALLSGDCPAAIWTGAANRSQIGAYLQIQETEAVTNVQLRAPEYLPALLESGVFVHPSHPLRRPAPPSAAYGYQPDPAGGLPGIGAGLI